ncbi:hypothetical protein EVAR_89109_1 [Eumeta japonica]|uniref:Uncharacterized protein n=1 Tax=Eumeta variegata TaxID=151549 RepID=A0A4C1XHG4_EUMVA|nr:hypothetical protein EVAR_89109_1 [Eumeta japonica]
MAVSDTDLQLALQSNPQTQSLTRSSASYHLHCCARGRPIIVEWERDARHSAGLSLVRLPAPVRALTCRRQRSAASSGDIRKPERQRMNFRCFHLAAPIFHQLSAMMAPTDQITTPTGENVPPAPPSPRKVLPIIGGAIIISENFIFQEFYEFKETKSQTNLIVSHSYEIVDTLGFEPGCFRFEGNALNLSTFIAHVYASCTDVHEEEYHHDKRLSEKGHS